MFRKRSFTIAFVPEDHPVCKKMMTLFDFRAKRGYTSPIKVLPTAQRPDEVRTTLRAVSVERGATLHEVSEYTDQASACLVDLSQDELTHLQWRSGRTKDTRNEVEKKARIAHRGLIALLTVPLYEPPLGTGVSPCWA